MNLINSIRLTIAQELGENLIKPIWGNPKEVETAGITTEIRYLLKETADQYLDLSKDLLNDKNLRRHSSYIDLKINSIYNHMHIIVDNKIFLDSLGKDNIRRFLDLLKEDLKMEAKSILANKK